MRVFLCIFKVGSGSRFYSFWRVGSWFRQFWDRILHIEGRGQLYKLSKKSCPVFVIMYRLYKTGQDFSEPDGIDGSRSEPSEKSGGLNPDSVLNIERKKSGLCSEYWKKTIRIQFWISEEKKPDPDLSQHKIPVSDPNFKQIRIHIRTYKKCASVSNENIRIRIRPIHLDPQPWSR